MTHEEMIKAVAKAMREKSDEIGDILFPHEDAALYARAAIRVIAPAVEQETVAKIVAWLREGGMFAATDIEIATAIEAREWK